MWLPELLPFVLCLFLAIVYENFGNLQSLVSLLHIGEMKDVTLVGKIFPIQNPQQPGPFQSLCPGDNNFQTQNIIGWIDLNSWIWHFAKYTKEELAFYCLIFSPSRSEIGSMLHHHIWYAMFFFCVEFPEKSL